MRRRSVALVGDHNRTAILRLIGREGRIARTTIARRLGLSPATVTALTRDLLERGLIQVVERAPSRGGRPAILLGLVSAAANALGVKIAPDHVVGVRVDLDAKVLDRFEEPFDAASPAALRDLVAILKPRLARSADASLLLGIGLGVPGVVDTRTGVVESPAVGWQGLHVAGVLEGELGVPVLVDNDVNTLAIAEKLYGRGHDVDHFLTVTIGRGVGLGIVIGGDVYRGARGGAGEFGHVSVVEDGPECDCGNRGCLEALVGDPALVRQARKRRILRRREGLDSLRRLADSGDPAARTLYAEAGSTLGRAVAGAVNLFSPQLVLVSGEGTQAWPHLAAAFDDAFRSALFGPLRDTPLEIDPWDDGKWARGAAALVLRATFLPALSTDDPDESIRARLSTVAAAQVVA